MKYFLLLFLFAFTFIRSQTYKVTLTSRTALDDNEIHVSPFYDNPKEELKLPNINLSDFKFFDLYLGSNDKEDYIVSILVFVQENRDLLYIDVNIDEDLTNDNSPFIFSYEESLFTFNIYPTSDSNQYIKYGISRNPAFIDSAMQSILDTLFYNPDGKLKKPVYLPYTINSPSFKGEKNSYYYDYRISLSRGEIILLGDTIKAGLFDYSNNGLFNDTSNDGGNVIIFDLDNDGKLTYSNNYEIYYLNEIFKINGNNYRIKSIDPYGRFLSIEKTDSIPNNRFLKYLSKLNNQYSDSAQIKLDDSFWQYTFTDIKGKKLKSSSFKNKTLLLNFWGEWCKPCIMEIPELLKINKETDIAIISFLKTTDLPKTKTVINEKQMNWTHVILDEEVEKNFNINGYPTNILVSKSGNILFSKHQINRFDVYRFIDQIK